LEVLESIETLARRIGLPVTVGEWKIDHRPASEDEAKALGIEVEAQVLCACRVVLAEERPVAYLVDILPDNLLTPKELEKATGGSILDLLLERGSPALLTSRTEINAVTASTELARSFGIQRGDVLLRFTAYLYSTEGRVVDYSFSYFLPGYFRFHVVRRVGKS
jgi:GntR family transcriptional regulator